MSQPEFLTSINARMALETPQVVASWDFTDAVSPFDPTVPWRWTEMRLRRDTYHYPESSTDGDEVLTEAYSASPSTSKADIGVLEDLTYYYSLFFKYPELSTNPLEYTQDIRRLFTQVRGVQASMPLAKSFGTDGVSVAGDPTFTAATATWLTSGVCAGDALLFDGNFYMIVEVTSETSMEVAFPFGDSYGPYQYTILTGEPTYMMAGTTHEGRERAFSYSTRTKLVTEYYDFTNLMAAGEHIIWAMHFRMAVDEDVLFAITNQRALQWIRNDGGIIPANLTMEYNGYSSWFKDHLDPGWEIGSAGVFMDKGISDCILDRGNKRIYVIQWNGNPLEVADLSGLPATDDLRGVDFDLFRSNFVVGNGNVVYSITGSSPAGVNTTEYLVYTRDHIDADLTVDLLTLMVYGQWGLFTVSNARGTLDRYLNDTPLGYLWQQAHTPYTGTLALYHLDESDPLADSGQHAFTLVNNGMNHRDSGGRFGGGCFQAQVNTAYLESDPSSWPIQPAQGTLSVWFKAASAASFTTAPGYFIHIPCNVGNEIYLGIADVGAGPQLVASHKGAGLLRQVAVAPPFVDLEWHHYAMTWAIFGDLKLYVDGVQRGPTVGPTGGWDGVALNSFQIGDSGGASALGYYDEVNFSGGVLPISAPTEVWTDRNYCHAYSGLDPAHRSFNYRDEMWTPKFMGGDWFIRNDYDVSPTPENIPMSDGEVVWRQSPKNLGDLGRLSRLLGLFLDRVADDRDHLIEAIDCIEHADDDFLSDLADRFGIQGLEPEPDWNVDQRRRWVRDMRRVLKEGGVQNSYHRLAELLGYRLRIDTLYTRRYLDSVKSPRRADVYLDQQGSLDTSDNRYPLARLRFYWYTQSVYSQAGAASVGDLLTDGGVNFTQMATAGSLVRVYSPEDPTNDGDYLVKSVVSEHVLLLNRSWADTALAGMHYSVNWHIAPADPLILYLTERANYIRPKVMRIEAL